jgi:hypothetical protein
MLKLSIGRLSNGEIVYLDLIQSRNIFLSYFKTEQLETFLRNIAEYSGNANNTMLYIATDSRYKGYFLENVVKLNVCQTYFFDKPFRSTIKNKVAFINSLHKEYTSRNRGKNKKEKRQTIIVIIDNIWNIIQNISKSSGSKLIELLSNSYAVEIHFIIASSTSYYNLFNQIIQPAHRKNEKLEGNPNLQENGIRNLGAEIIYNSDELIFLKYHNSLELNRLYKI